MQRTIQIATVLMCIIASGLWGQNSSSRSPIVLPSGGAGAGTTAAQETAAQDSIIEHLRNTPLHGFLGIDLTYSAPTGEFKTILDSLDKTFGMGFSIHGGYSFAPLPIALGVRASFLFYGSTEEQVYNGRTYRGIRLQDTISTSNTIVPLSITARIQPDLNYIKPWVDFSVGFSIISASRTVKVSSPHIDSVFVTKLEESSSSKPFHYGFGGGIAVKFADVFNIPDSRQAWYAYAGLHFLKGDYSNYKFWDAQTNSFREGNSRTDLMLVNVGVVFEF